ncbi:MAG: hypothetical protein WC972_12490 [Trueperaceae bacterium]
MPPRQPNEPPPPPNPKAALAGVYLRPLPGEVLPARHSAGARVRAAQMQAFLQPLHASALRALDSNAAVTLLVLGPGDWRKVCRYPYGLPFTRTGVGGGNAAVIAAADYQPRLLRRFEEVMLVAARAGVSAPAQPGEFIDLLVGHEWGHAVANLSGLRTRLKWLDELNATYIFVQALRATGQVAILERLAAWSRWQVAGTEHEASDLASFEYPRTRAGWVRLLWYQGVFAERALEMSEDGGWGYLLRLREALPPADRGELARKLVEIEPSFRPWFAVFGRAQRAPGEPG